MDWKLNRLSKRLDLPAERLEEVCSLLWKSDAFKMLQYSERIHGIAGNTNLSNAWGQVEKLVIDF